jgi:multidrug efflux system outer membrane protein
MSRKSILPFIIISCALLGCTVGPKYSQPNIEMPQDWHNNVSGGMAYDSPDNFLWWKALNDPMLDWLIECAALQNLDVSIAATRVLIARAESKGLTNNLLMPHIDATAGYEHVQYNKNTLDKILGIESAKNSPHHKLDLFEFGFDADWEIDLFGYGRHEACAAEAGVQSVEEEFRDAWITLSAEIAKNYVELRGLQLRLSIMDKNLDAQKSTLSLSEGLVKTGFASSIDQKLAESQLRLMQAERPLLELQVHRAVHRLSVLLGYHPGVLFDELNDCAELPQVPCHKPIGLPSELLRRRPDIRRAERNLAAATEKIGSAVASLFPRISLTGFIGDAGLCGGDGFTWYGGAQLLSPLFNSRMVEQDIKINTHKARQALYEYQKTVLYALEETENAIAAYNGELERNHYLSLAEKSSKEAREMNLQLYEKGFKNYLEQLDSDRTALSAEDAYYQSQVVLLTDYIALYKSLGGGWCTTECE